MPSKKRLPQIAALLVLILPGMAAGSAAFGSPEKPHHLSESQVADMLTIANQESIGFEEAVARYVWQDEAALVMSDIAQAYPDAFYEAEVVSEDPPIVNLVFAGGSIPSGVEEFIADVPSGIRVDLFADAPRSAIQVEVDMEAVHQAARSSSVVTDNVVTTYDREANVFRVEAEPATLDLTQRELNFHAGLLERDIGTKTGLDAQVVLTPGFSSGRDDVRYGGGRLERLSANSLECTSGFNVRSDSTSVTGVATAGHCGAKSPNNVTLTHENTKGATEHQLSFRGEHYGYYRDFEWRSTTDGTNDDFYNAPGSTRDVAAVSGDPMVNQQLCRYGQASGQKCSKVVEISICAGELCRLVRMNSRLATGGDSGGPWFGSGTGTAYGYHQGGVKVNGYWYDTYSKGYNIGVLLNVSIRTS